jgi:hypothetical protein
MCAKTCLFATYVIAAACIGFILWKCLFEEHNRYVESDPPQKAQQQSSDKGPGEDGVLIGAAKEPAKEPTAEERIATWTKVLAIVAALTGIFGVVQIRYLVKADRTGAITAQAARDAADVANKTLIASRRPWVSVDVTLGKPLEFETGTGLLRLTLQFAMKNIGNDPAFYVFPHFEIVSGGIHGGPGSVKRKLEEVCGEIKTRKGVNTGGITLFPDQPIRQSLNVGMAKSEMDAELARGIPTPEELHVPKTISPIIVGCVDYQFGDPREHHQTWFAYEIWDKGTDTFRMDGPAVVVTDGPIAEGRLALIPMLIERDAFYAD